jgi:hypothetical protein
MYQALIRLLGVPLGRLFYRPPYLDEALLGFTVVFQTPVGAFTPLIMGSAEEVCSGCWRGWLIKDMCLKKIVSSKRIYPLQFLESHREIIA